MSSSAIVGENDSPLLAATDCPSRLAIDHSYASRLQMRLAMRSGSTALVSAIIE